MNEHSPILVPDQISVRDTRDHNPVDVSQVGPD